MDNDLISRSALIKSYFDCCRTEFEIRNCCMTAENVINIICNAPTADTDLSKYSDKLWKEAYERGKNERPKGKWIESDVPESVLVKCSICGFDCGAKTHNFCPECGSDMRGE